MSQVGVVIGRHTASKASVLQLVQCPMQDSQPPIRVSVTDSGAVKNSGGGSAKGRIGGPGAKIDIDEDWVVEHAMQVARTLPGGLDVLGIYVLCEDRAFQKSHGTLSNVLKSVRGELTDAPDAVLVVHIDAVSAKIAAKEEAAGALRPCEVKGSNLLANMAAINCQYKLQLNVSLMGSNQRLHEAIQQAIQWEYDHRVIPALYLMNDKSVPLEKQVMELSGSDGRPLSVRLFPPVSMLPATIAAVGPRTDSACSSSGGEYECQATLSISNTIDCRAFVNKRENVEAAIEAVKADVQRSLLSRLDVLVEAAEMATTLAEQKASKIASQSSAVDGKKAVPPRHPLLKEVNEVVGYRPVLPRRAFLEWQQGGCCYCDYIVEGEGITEVVERMNELMGEGAVNPASFQCAEKGAAGQSMVTRGSTKSGVAFACDYSLVAAGVVVLLAVAYAAGYL